MTVEAPLVQCDKCTIEGWRSRVYLGGTFRTAVGVDQYYDEDGKLHVHDGNANSQSFACSNGHSWTVTSYRKCWCGWISKMAAMSSSR